MQTAFLDTHTTSAQSLMPTDICDKGRTLELSSIYNIYNRCTMSSLSWNFYKLRYKEKGKNQLYDNRQRP